MGVAQCLEELGLTKMAGARSALRDRMYERGVDVAQGAPSPTGEYKVRRSRVGKDPAYALSTVSGAPAQETFAPWVKQAFHDELEKLGVFDHPGLRSAYEKNMGRLSLSPENEVNRQVEKAMAGGASQGDALKQVQKHFSDSFAAQEGDFLKGKRLVERLEAATPGEGVKYMHGVGSKFDHPSTIRHHAKAHLDHIQGMMGAEKPPLPIPEPPLRPPKPNVPPLGTSEVKKVHIPGAPPKIPLGEAAADAVGGVSGRAAKAEGGILKTLGKHKLPIGLGLGAAGLAGMLMGRETRDERQQREYMNNPWYSRMYDKVRGRNPYG